MGVPDRPPYRKVLYLRQPYPDNWVDSSFLSDLQRNVNVHPASLPVLLRQTLPITQHLACILIFVAVFVRLAQRSLDPSVLLASSAALGVAFRVWSILIGEADLASSTSSTSSVAAPLIPLVALYLLSPALKTLTRSTTSDSIWALSGTLFTVNLLFGDYRAIPETSAIRPDPVVALFPFVRRFRSTSAPSPRTPRRTVTRRGPLPSTLSLTAALSGSTVLASRLASNSAVFSLLLFSTLWFGPFPHLRSTLTLRPTLALTYLVSTVALLALRPLGTGTVRFAAATLFGSSVVAPFLRGWLMIRYKDKIRGPWDQAVPRVGELHPHHL
ncbi:hypothetical protein JCM10212_006395 [Sporobolomyces blumeae]